MRTLAGSLFVCLVMSSIGCGSPAGAPSEDDAAMALTVTTSGAPSAPQNLSAGVSENGVVLLWSPPASGGPVTEYQVLRGPSSGAETLLASAGTDTQYLDSSVMAGTYFYVVVAVNGAGVSPPSNEQMAQPIFINQSAQVNDGPCGCALGGTPSGAIAPSLLFAAAALVARRRRPALP